MAGDAIRRDMSMHEDYGSEKLKLRSEVAEKYSSLLDGLSGAERTAALDKLVVQEQQRRATAQKNPKQAKAEEEVIEVEPMSDAEAAAEIFPMWQEWAEQEMTPETLGRFNAEFAQHLGAALREGRRSEEHIISEGRRRYQHVVYQMYAKANEEYSSKELMQQFETWLNLHWPKIEAAARQH